MSTYDPTRPLFSLHIPKTAGSSFRGDLIGWFGADNVAFHYRDARNQPPERIEPRPGLCVHGHFNRVRGIGVLDYYPGADQFLVMLRHPFTRFVSQWRYLHFQRRNAVDVPALGDDPSFATWIARRAEAAGQGEDPFSFLAQLPRPIDPARVCDTFGADFLAVGITEDYARSLRLFAEVLGFQVPQDTTWVNRAGDSWRQGDPAEDFSAWKADHARLFPLEYAVYEEGLRRMESEVARRDIGPSAAARSR